MQRLTCSVPIRGLCHAEMVEALDDFMQTALNTHSEPTLLRRMTLTYQIQQILYVVIKWLAGQVSSLVTGIRMANDRIFQSDDGKWYFRVRGNQDVGPFETEAQAAANLEERIANWTGRTSPTLSWPRSWHPARIFRRSAPRQP